MGHLGKPGYCGCFYVKYSTRNQELNDKQLNDLCVTLHKQYPSVNFEQAHYASGNARAIMFHGDLGFNVFEPFIGSLKPKLVLSRPESGYTPNWKLEELAEELQALVGSRFKVEAYIDDVTISGGQFKNRHRLLGDTFQRNGFTDSHITKLHTDFNSNHTVDLSKAAKDVANDIYEILKSGYLGFSVDELAKMLEFYGVIVSNDGKVTVKQ